MKILYICPNYDNKTYSYYGLIPDGLKKLGCNINIIKSINNTTILNNYDVVMFGYRGFNNIFYGKKIRTTAKMYNLLGAQSCHEFKNKGFTLNHNNIINLTSMFRINYLKENFFNNIEPFGYSFYPEIFKDYGNKKIYDVGMSGALHSSNLYPNCSFIKGEENIRQRVYDKIMTLKNKYNFFLKCSDNFNDSRIFTDIEYAKTINSTKIWIACHSAYGDIPSRHYQIPPCRTLLFCNEQDEDHFKDIFKNGENCVFFKNDLSDFEEKVDYYLNNKDEYNRIVENGYKEFNEKHTNIQRANDLLKIINNN